MNAQPSLSPDDVDLLTRAAAVAERAHAPHSGYRVGAALRTAAGEVFAGCNVENASYGLTLCAERAAVAAAVAAEGTAMRVAAIAIHVAAGRPFPPCGACRQVLAEFSTPETRVIWASAGSRGPEHATMGELLPRAFRL